MKEIEFFEELKKININITEKQKEELEIFYNFLVEYNSHTNLTAITKKEEVYLKHFYDSILLSQATDLTKISNMLDIGCGAGFPGIVIKIMFPHIYLTLLDSNNKKTKFCEELIKKLELKNVEIINKRAEEYIEDRREYYDLVTARAVKDLSILDELAIPYVKINGNFIAMKSDCTEELENSKKGIEKLGGKYIETKNLSLPRDNGKRSFVIINKIKTTNKIYPRQYNKIIKNTL